MASPPRDPITCHVLDTTTGRPGPNIAVTLSCYSHPSVTFMATTNDDGRIANWTTMSLSASSGDTALSVEGLIKQFKAVEGSASCPQGASTWKITFDTGSYYGIANTFFPIVELTFLAKEGEHFHVPLLLGPYSFTTYRGS